MSKFEEMAVEVWQELDTPTARLEGRSADELADLIGVERWEIYHAVARLKDALQEPNRQPISRQWVFVEEEGCNRCRYFLADDYDDHRDYEYMFAKELRTRIRRFSRTVNSSALKWNTGAGAVQRRRMRMDAARLLEDIELLIAEYETSNSG